MTDRVLRIRDLGTQPYEEAYAEQKALVQSKRSNPHIADYLLLVEHPEVYTYGRKSKAQEQSLPGVAVERGGQATYHNPGQLVGYPILSLEPGHRDLHRYMRKIESILIQVLSNFGVAATRRESCTGVWVSGGERKIASIGVAVSGWVTYHGFALNVCNDLAGFARIHPCGFDSRVMTSMLELLGKPHCPSMEDVKTVVMRDFTVAFGQTTGSIAYV